MIGEFLGVAGSILITAAFFGVVGVSVSDGSAALVCVSSAGLVGVLGVVGIGVVSSEVLLC